MLGKEGNGPEVAVADHPELSPSLMLKKDDEEILFTNDNDMKTTKNSGQNDGSSKSDMQRRTDEEVRAELVRKLLAAEDREREAKRAVEVQRKLVEEAQQRSVDNLKHSTNMQRSEDIMNYRGTADVQSLMTKNREKTRQEAMEDVIREQAIWV